MSLLEKNGKNRLLSQAHVNRLAREIREGRWQYNGDTIKIANNDDVLDGQHRLWAAIEAQMPIKTIIVNGIEPDAFTTIDTIRRTRSHADTVYLHGVHSNTNAIATGLNWLLRWKSGTITNSTYRQSGKRIENEDIKKAMIEHPNMVAAVQKTRCLRNFANHGMLACFYYMLCWRGSEGAADDFLEAMRDAALLSQRHPYFLLRRWLINHKAQQRRLDPEMAFAMMIKAANATHAGRRIDILQWRNQGPRAEEFPTLSVS